MTGLKNADTTAATHTAFGFSTLDTPKKEKKKVSRPFNKIQPIAEPEISPNQLKVQGLAL